MVKNNLRLMDMDEHLREKYEKLFSLALTEANKRNCVIDVATSDVTVYLEIPAGNNKAEDVSAISPLMPGYKDYPEELGIADWHV